MLPPFESFKSSFFKKLAGVKGRVAPYIVRKTQERVNFFAKQRKRENPRRGFSFLVSLCLEFYFATFLEKGSAKNFTEGKVFAYILRSTILPRVILSGTKWSRTRRAMRSIGIYEGIMSKKDRRERRSLLPCFI